MTRPCAKLCLKPIKRFKLEWLCRFLDTDPSCVPSRSGALGCESPTHNGEAGEVDLVGWSGHCARDSRPGDPNLADPGSGKKSSENLGNLVVQKSVGFRG